MNRIYIAGPMTGLPDNNYPAFNKVASQLAGMGFIALNPAENKGPTWNDFMRQAIRQLSQAEGVFFLPGWQKSKGAQLEMTIAKALELPIIQLPERAEAGAQAQVIDPRAVQLQSAALLSKKQADEAYEKALMAEQKSRLAADDHPAQGLNIPKSEQSFQPKAHHSRWQIEVYNLDDTWTTLGVTYSSELVSPMLKMLKNLYPRQDLYVKGYVD